MCGFIFGYKKDNLDEDLQHHRGPDSRGIFESQEKVLLFQRLAIMDLTSEGDQPFLYKKYALVCNGEIYNFQELKKELDHDFQSESDCEVIIPTIEKYGILNACQRLDGEFAFVALKDNKVLAARDPMGIRPLFYGRGKDGEVRFSSEMKSLIGICDKIYPFPPGHIYQDGEFKEFHSFLNKKTFKNNDKAILNNIKILLEKGVEKRLNSDAPLGFLLSGGLDSSLVCAIAQRKLKKPIKTFSVGIETNPIDTKYAREVAEYIGSDHKEYLFTEKDLKDNLENVIYHLESWDITTIRASMGMYLICKFIKENSDIKVLLTGEVSDELFGYKYTDFAPTGEEFQKEAEKRIKELYLYDVLRADRCIAAHSLEARVPFSDKFFVDYVMEISPQIKMNSTGIGKYLLRKAFEESEILPKSILYREKAAFSDAVGHRAVDFLKEMAEEKYSDKVFQEKILKYEIKPLSKEALMYREIFDKFFPNQSHVIPNYWMPNKSWKNCDVNDPSARVLPNYGKSGK